MPLAKRRFFWTCWTLICLGLTWVAARKPIQAAEPQPVSQQAVDFNRQIRHILSENCFACHGPDEKARKGKFRLDTKDGAIKKRSDTTPIVPGRPDDSEVIRRLLTTDPDDHMPPPDSGKKVTPAQIELLKKWIAQGADYSLHWSFKSVTQPLVPTLRSP